MSSEEVRERETTAEERRQRRLLFDAVNEALGRCLAPHAPSPLKLLQFQAQRLPLLPQPAGVGLLRSVWQEIHDWPVATSEDVYDILDDAARRDMLRGNDKWSAEQIAESELIDVVSSIEGEIVEELMMELGEEWRAWEKLWVVRQQQRQEERARRQALRQAKQQLAQEQQALKEESEQQAREEKAAKQAAERAERNAARPSSPRHRPATPTRSQAGPTRSQGTPTRSPLMGSSAANTRRGSLGGGPGMSTGSSAGSRRSLDKTWLRGDGRGVGPGPGVVRSTPPTKVSAALDIPQTG